MLESIIIVTAVLLDRLSKIWAINSLKSMPNLQRQFIPGVLEFRYVENTGSAFSMLSGHRWLFVVLTTVVLVALTIYLIKNRKKENIYTRIALACVIGGALGNYIDRILYGYVVDMLSPVFINFAIFNVADIFITLGTAALVVIILFFTQSDKKDKSKLNEGK